MWLDISVQRAIRAGRGTPRGAVVVDFRGVDPARAKPPRPQHRPTATVVALGDPTIEVTHAAHAINGGIRVSEHGESTVPGLFAVGEVIAGPHGADRLGGGMLAACTVFGARAGARAAAIARSAERVDAVDAPLERPLARVRRYVGGGSTTWGDVRRELKALTAATILVVRNGSGLRRAIERARELRLSVLPTSSGEVGYLLETENLLLTAEVMARAALAREESRGSHFREDFPVQDDARWLTNLVWREERGEPAMCLARYRQDPDSPIQVARVEAVRAMA
jgi:L-aspartate oxidase